VAPALTKPCYGLINVFRSMMLPRVATISVLVDGEEQLSTAHQMVVPGMSNLTAILMGRGLLMAMLGVISQATDSAMTS